MRRALRGGIAKDKKSADQFSARVSNGSGCLVDGPLRAIFGHEHGVVGQSQHRTIAKDLRHRIVNRLTCGLVDDVKTIHQWFALRLVQSPSSKGFRHPVLESNSALQVRADDRVSDAFKRHAKTLLTASQPFAVAL